MWKSAVVLALLANFIYTVSTQGSSASSAAAAASQPCSSGSSASASASSSSSSSGGSSSSSSASSSAQSSTTCDDKNKCTRQNEVYDLCPAKCPFRTCGIDDTLIDCIPSPTVGDPDCPPPSCRCADSFYRDDKGNCVKWEDCPKCVNPNEEYDPCPAPCPPGRCDVDPSLVQCQVSPQLGDPACDPACRCLDNYARNDEGTCIPREQCPLSCQANEVFSNCTQAVCGAQYCSQKGQPVACAAIADCSCTAGCVCANNYLRDENGTCIPEDQCNAGQNECNKPNEEYQQCPGCSPGTCESIGKEYNCPLQPSDTTKCSGACRCKAGYYYNKIGECITEDQCLQCNGEHEYFSCGPECDNVCATLDKQNKTNCPIVNIQCNKKCYCEDGYARDENNICVPIEQCTENKCPRPNEVYDLCPAKCPFRTCGIDDTLIDCIPSPTVGDPDCPPPSCRCADSFYRDDKGNCVKWEDCPKCANPNEEYDPCPAPCPPRRCDVDPSLVLCQVSPQLGDPACEPGCRCLDNFARNDEGTCIPREQCPLSCQANEVFSNCTQAVCGAQYCSQRGQPVACAAIAEGSCTAGCVCANDYLRDENGTCIPEDQCNAGQNECNKPNEEYQQCPGCSPGTCESIGKEYNCPLQPSDTSKCSGACRCKAGYYYNKIGECITEDQCLHCNGNYEYYSCGPECDNVCATLDKQNKTNCPIVNIQCNKKCYCEDGYARDENNICVPIEQCTGICKENERYVQCPDAECVPKTCADAGFPVACPRIASGRCSSEPACICNSGYLSNSDGVCVPQKECPSCGGDPNARPGCGVNCGRLCSNYQNSSEIACLDICNLNGCDCIKGYVLDTNTGKCVLPEQCTPPCGQYEVYSNCINGGCDKRNCSQINDPKICINPLKCEGGCVCQEGYLRNSNGACVPQDQCQPIDSCNGDPNAKPGCGVNCGKLCSNYQRDDVACILICNKNGCDCKDNYVFDSNTGKCVLPNQCTPTCKTNEIFSNCTQGVCGAQYCSQKGQSVACAAVAEGSCSAGCVCAENYLRAENGTCIPEDQCDVPVCGQDEVFSSCANGGCGRWNCSQLSQPQLCIDPIKCEGGCICRDGYLRDENAVCIPQENCSTSGQNECNKPNEEYQQCPSCSPGTCESIGKEYNCPLQPSDTSKCSGACRCKAGYYYNKIGECITEDQCLQCNGEHEYFSCGPECDNVCATLDKQNKTNCPIVNIQCNKKCYCEDGYARDENNICVPIEQCTASCGGDPNARPGCGVNCGRLCSNYQNSSKIACPAICNLNGCDCIKGYVLDTNGKCVLPEQCTPPCGQYEVYSNCINGGCDKRNCSQINDPKICIHPLKCEGGCVCQAGYLRNSNGACVPQDQCEQKSCGGDPNAKPGCGNNCGRHCSNYKTCQPIACPDVCDPNGCDCKDGFVFDSNIGKCVTPDQCTPTCQANEEFTNCTQGICRNQNCSQKGQSVACTDIIDQSFCTSGCVCAENYLRAADGTCVPEAQCDVCPEGETFSDCPPVYRSNCNSELCPASRNDPPVCATTRQCGEPRCVCDYLRKRDRETGQCVLASDCPPFPCTGPNEEYRSCPASCPGENCTDYLSGSQCPKYKIGIVIPCQPQCRCLDGFYRNSDGICVKSSECKECPEGEFYSKCPPTKCDAEYCPQSRDDPLTCPTPKTCIQPRCVCGFNSRRDRLTGKCIPTSQCPSFPCDGQNEEYDSCPPPCPGQKCSDYINNSTCPTLYRIGIVVPCKPACRCTDNTYRNTKGTCVTPDECECE